MKKITRYHKNTGKLNMFKPNLQEEQFAFWTDFGMTGHIHN